MSDACRLAIVGATGLVGETLIQLLAERQFPLKALYLLASERSAGQGVSTALGEIPVQAVADFDFTQADVVIFSAGQKVSATFAPKAADAGCIVIDNSSSFRYEYDVPLVIPEVNHEAIAQYRNCNIIANPNCSTIQMLLAVKPIYDLVGVERINVVTFQAVSGMGRRAVNELRFQSQAVLSNEPVETTLFPKQMAFNVLPQIDVFEDNAYSREEMKMVRETQKILADDSVQVNPTCVRVPVINGHSMAVHLETSENAPLDTIVKCLEEAPGVKVFGDITHQEYATPALDIDGENAVLVSRIRQDISHARGINFWCVADNLRKGAALNSIQIAECLVKEYL